MAYVYALILYIYQKERDRENVYRGSLLQLSTGK